QIYGHQCSHTTVLSSKTILKEMNLNNSRLLDSGAKEICEGLKNLVCELKILKLSNCDLNEESCSALTSVLSSDFSSLRDLYLSNNNLHDSGVKLLSDGLKENCKLEKLSPAAQEACEYLTEMLGVNPLVLKELDLSEDKLGDLDGEKLSALLMDSHIIIKDFQLHVELNNCKLTEKSCSVLATVLSSKTILKEMNLNNSRLLNSGVKEICEGLKNPVCELKILNLRKCGLTEESCSALATVLRSNSSLKELDMSNNNLQDSGVKKLQNGLENTNCTLQKLSLRKCGLTEESCSALATVLRSNSSLKELDMSNNNLQDSGVKKLQNGLENTNCTLQKLRVLGENLLLLRELNLSELKLGHYGLMKLAMVLQDKHCKLNTLM
uniref:Uncharacterized protein n=1 Tax=Sinocyclocheilus grahami TaxID=75366 RepID=A0A672QYE7_SINGR